MGTKICCQERHPWDNIEVKELIHVVNFVVDEETKMIRLSHNNADRRRSVCAIPRHLKSGKMSESEDEDMD